MIVEPSFWCSPPQELRLGRDEIHLWRASLRQPAEVIADLRRSLSSDEQARAGRYHFEEHRTHFTVARGILRAILGRYVKLPPAEIRFRYGPFGKPALAAECARNCRLHFNLGHSEGLALYAVSWGLAVGVDLELVRPALAGYEVAERFFAPPELDALSALPPEGQTEAFFNCWTRKEAFIKATGLGLSLPLDRFVVSVAPGEPAALRSINGNPRLAARWTLRDLIPTAGYVGALAAARRECKIKPWQWRHQIESDNMMVT
jgi:4'-phosphopantetheinyl transferase